MFMNIVFVKHWLGVAECEVTYLLLLLLFLSVLMGSCLRWMVQLFPGRLLAQTVTRRCVTNVGNL